MSSAQTRCSVDLFGQRVVIPVKNDTFLHYLLSHFICYGEMVPGTLLDRVVSMGKSPSKRAFNSQHVP